MYRKLAAAAVLMVGLAIGSPGQARPYLMLAADDKGFRAADLGGIKRQGTDSAQITLIDAPLAGVSFGGAVAALMEEQVEFECQGTRWRTLSIHYADAKEVTMGDEPAAGDWRAIGGDPLLAAAKEAACLRRYNQGLVSRILNLGAMVTNYQKAWGPAPAEPLTRQQLAKQRFDAGH